VKVSASAASASASASENVRTQTRQYKEISLGKYLPYFCFAKAGGGTHIFAEKHGFRYGQGWACHMKFKKAPSIIFPSKMLCRVV
jgi:hypothetical protein